MLLETCRYRLVDGKIETKMFPMGVDDWDIEPGWCHDKKTAKAAAEKPKEPKKAPKIDGRSKEARQLKAKQDGDSSGFNQLGG